MNLSDKAVTIDPEETLWRTLQTFNVTRVVIAALLLVFLSLGARKGLWSYPNFPFQETCAAYVALAVAFLLLAVSYRRRLLLQLAMQVAMDIAVISALYIAAGGAKGGLTILFLFPLAGAAVLAPMLLALFFVSIVTLILLAEGGLQLLSPGEDTPISQIGLYGGAFFAAVFVINRMAARLIKQERLAAQHSLDLRIQQAINRLIIADMGDGILVVGREGQIFTANPAAEKMLGLSFPDDGESHSLRDLPTLLPIADAFFKWSAGGDGRLRQDSDKPFVVAVRPGERPSLQASSTGWGGRREPVVHLKMRIATVDAPRLRTERAVIFLQDVSEIENQAQQLKLASMGRLTASIAHEVRNPLSAISYAASLLGEELADAAQTRLVAIVNDNVARLNRMIEDILKLSRRAQSRGEPILLLDTVEEILEEFRELHSLKEGLIQVSGDAWYRMRFDPMHLREVLVNLLSNALRYASGRRGCIQLRLAPDAGGRLELHVKDDGPAISPEVRAHLFEPFYTTSSKGTGLGLYVARELCLNNGAMLDYEYRMDGQEHGNPSGRFVITFAVQSPAELLQPENILS